jgi:hypothetical protein
VYTSKIGPFFMGIILTLMIIGMCVSCWSYSLNEILFAIVFGSLMFASASGLICMWRMTKYTFTERSLLIRSWLAKHDIEYSSITQIEDTTNPWEVHNMPVILSSDLIRIKYGKRNETVHISPVRKQEFLSKLQARCPLVRS